MIIDAVISSKTSKKATSNATEKTVRSIAKTISWRIIGTLDTMMIAWILTGELSLAFSIGSIEVVSKMILYFMHERAWNSINWGK